jgi:hypothetical protein
MIARPLPASAGGDVEALQAQGWNGNPWRRCNVTGNPWTSMRSKGNDRRTRLWQAAFSFMRSAVGGTDENVQRPERCQPAGPRRIILNSSCSCPYGGRTPTRTKRFPRISSTLSGLHSQARNRLGRLSKLSLGQPRAWKGTSGPMGGVRYRITDYPSQHHGCGWSRAMKPNASSPCSDALERYRLHNGQSRQIWTRLFPDPVSRAR